MGPMSAWNLKTLAISVPPKLTMTSSFYKPSSSLSESSFPFRRCTFAKIPYKPLETAIHARKKDPKPQPVLKPSIVEEISMEDEEDQEEEFLFDELEDDAVLEDGDNFEDEFEEDEAELYAGDGAGGGGVSLAGTWWDKAALTLAEDVCLSFDGELGIYAFRTLANSTIQVRIERPANKSGSPDMEDIEAFSVAYRARLDEAELAKAVPENITLEVSSPGVERVVRIPQDLERFKERAMYVKYVTESGETGSTSESEGIFSLVSFDTETKCCTWGLANVRINREKAGKGRPLSKKQREWRLVTTFDSLRLVRIYSEA